MVDDDLLQTLGFVIEKHGLPVETYSNCEDFLPAVQGTTNVLWAMAILLASTVLNCCNGRHIQFIMMTGHSNMAMLVNTMKAGCIRLYRKADQACPQFVIACSATLIA